MPTLIPNPPRSASELIGRDLTWREAWELRLRYAGAKSVASFCLNRGVLYAVGLPVIGPVALLGLAFALAHVGSERLSIWLGESAGWMLRQLNRISGPMECPWHLKPGERGRQFMENERALQALKDMALVDDRLIEEARRR